MKKNLARALVTKIVNIDVLCSNVHFRNDRSSNVDGIFIAY